ncbi:HD-GYP domain-containing protein [Clostridium folliculivorans]|uniref:HD-GYP domain-containing protein n=1 Tax=Clostridium folliculivorans TaxID=2886038 RepID=A0A9W5Y0I5_9CLOT|nr:HD-GYP domain-containing protein [Clostridium folliculivorans]GKU24489.1 hypothetical protein CFOLD11_13150 [Clostridium folliculivorans]GKU30587.1 hypothetical protein CFB3_26940 [Clostridium folliculivorans]
MKLKYIHKKIRWEIFENNSKLFRFITLLTFFIAIIIEMYDSSNHPNPTFVLIMIASGISLFKIYQHLFVSFATVAVNTYFSPFFQRGPFNGSRHDFIHYLMYFFPNWISYFLIGYIITYLIKVHSKHNKDTVDFIKTLARTIESRDFYTASHSKNVAKYARIIAEGLKYSKADCETVYVGALLHDIGKIGISDSILNKPIKLSKEEYKLIQQHPIIGYDILKLVQNFNENKILDMILCHHERYDGLGYPKGLIGDEIPQCAAIIAVADAFDAMTSNRVYRKSLDPNYAINELSKNSGTQFNPLVTSVFIKYILENPTDFQHNDDLILLNLI